MQANTDKVRWGIIGCGAVTEHKSGPAFQLVEGSELHAVMRRTSDKARDYAERHGVSVWTDDAAELIANPEVDAVYVATPPDTHAAYATAAMRAGKPVYVEKPMARTVAECEEMNRVSRETGVPLFVAYYRRTLPGFLKAKEWVDNDVIGRPLTVRIELLRPALAVEATGQSWRVQPEIAGGGLFYDLASHQLDYLDFLFGPIAECAGFARNAAGLYPAEDTVAATWRFENGVIGTGDWCFVAPEEAARDRIEIIGERGRILFSSFDPQPIRLYHGDEVEEYAYRNPENIQRNLIQQVVEAIRFGHLCVSTGESAARTNAVMARIVPYQGAVKSR